jgi:hypothetical protein
MMTSPQTTSGMSDVGNGNMGVSFQVYENVAAWAANSKRHPYGGAYLFALKCISLHVHVHEFAHMSGSIKAGYGPAKVILAGTHQREYSRRPPPRAGPAP